MQARLVFSKKYDFGLLGLDKLHPFDNHKYVRAWQQVSRQISIDRSILHIPTQPISAADLLIGHTQHYLDSLRQSKTVAQVIEVSPVRFIPNRLLHYSLITPLKYACQGTLEATEIALDGHMVMNIGGGFHHAYADHGEGFCFFADAALAILQQRQNGKLNNDDTVLMIDLDAHRGNGFESFFTQDPAVKIFDMYNAQVYPGLHNGDFADFPYMIPLKLYTKGARYLEILHKALPSFVDTAEQPRLAFYNAGSDILSGDPLGALDVAFAEVLERDRFVLDELRKRGIPTVVMTSGGYSKRSYELVAELIKLVVSGE